MAQIGPSKADRVDFVCFGDVLIELKSNSVVSPDHTTACFNLWNL